MIDGSESTTQRDGTRPPTVVGGRAITAVAALAAATTGAVLIVTWLAAAALARTVDSPSTLERWANLGEAFGIISSVLSGMAFVALIVTLWIQLRELALQRSELALQRQAIERSSGELRRTAEAEMRSLHFELLRLSIQDPTLAQVWPEPPHTDPQRRKQLLYANLIYQHLVLSMTLWDAPETHIRATLRHVFGSEIMREYWTRASELRRQTDVPETTMWRIGRIGDEVVDEYQRS